MMFTPTPNSRRPRPPGGSSRRPPIRDPSLKSSTNNKPLANGHFKSDVTLPPPLVASSSFESCSSSSTSSFPSDTPLQIQLLRRQELARSRLGRISASPDGSTSSSSGRVDVELEDVSLDLDPNFSRSQLFNGGPVIEENDESLPPPYAAEISKKTSTQSLRNNSSIVNLNQSSSPKKNDDVEVMRDKIQAMKRIIKQRSLDVLVTAEIANQLLHEHAHKITSPPSRSTSRASTPFSSPSPPRGLRAPVSRSHRGGLSIAVSQSRILAIQAEADERVANLEAALADARSSEEAQRKAAARLRRDLDKLRRELDRADANRIEEEAAAAKPLGLGTPRPLPYRPERQRHQSHLSLEWTNTIVAPLSHRLENVNDLKGEEAEEDEDAMTSKDDMDVDVDADVETEDEEELEGDRSPELPGDMTVEQVATAMDEVTDRLARMSMESIRSTVSDMLGMSSRHKHRKLRRPVSTSTFSATSPVATPIITVRNLRPRVSIAPITPPNKRSLCTTQAVGSSPSSPSGKSSSTRYRRSPWPKTSSVFAATSTVSPSLSHDRFTSAGPSPCPSPTRPRRSDSRSVTPFSALNDKMATMRAFVVDSLRMGSRSLGSELGEVEDENNGSPKAQGLIGRTRPLLHLGENENEPDQQGGEFSDEQEEQPSEDDAHVFYSPAPIPPKVSAALSSLALALASPTPVFNAFSISPLRPISRLRWSPPNRRGGSGLATKRIVPRKDFSEWDSLGGDDEEDPDEWIDCPPSNHRDPLSRHLHLRPLILASRATASSSGSYPLPLSLTNKIALAHRRNLSNISPITSTSTTTTVGLSTPLSAGMDIDHDNFLANRRPRTIPGRLVHDLICLLLVSLEYGEWLLILLYRLFLDLRHGPRLMGLRGRANQTRYYLMT